MPHTVVCAWIEPYSPAWCAPVSYVLLVSTEARRKGETEPPPAARTEGQEEHRAFNAMVGDAIRRSRQEHGWTQAFLAEQSGLSPNYIARLERGELGPSLFVAHRICAALAIDLEVLVTPNTGAPQPKRSTTRRRVIAG
jgi:ribosome-binding protein aMBF1 (putative translation factor)